jgi:hypothetical protein
MGQHGAALPGRGRGLAAGVRSSERRRAWADSSKRASVPDAEPPPRARWSTHFSGERLRQHEEGGGDEARGAGSKREASQLISTVKREIQPVPYRVRVAVLFNFLFFNNAGPGSADRCAAVQRSAVTRDNRYLALSHQISGASTPRGEWHLWGVSPAVCPGRLLPLRRAAPTSVEFYVHYES